MVLYFPGFPHWFWIFLAILVAVLAVGILHAKK